MMPAWFSQNSLRRPWPFLVGETGLGHSVPSVRPLVPSGWSGGHSSGVDDPEMSCPFCFLTSWLSYSFEDVLDYRQKINLSWLVLLLKIIHSFDKALLKAFVLDTKAKRSSPCPQGVYSHDTKEEKIQVNRQNSLTSIVIIMGQRRDIYLPKCLFIAHLLWATPSAQIFHCMISSDPHNKPAKCL